MLFFVIFMDLENNIGILKKYWAELMKSSIFLIAILFAPLAVEAQYQIINPTVNQEEEEDYKKRQRLQAERIRMEQQQQMQRQQMQFIYRQR